MNWNNIRPLQGQQDEGFEELVCQLARKEKIENQITFIRKGKPDAGVECYWILEDKIEIAWQAKFFLTSPNANQWGQIDKSVETALDKHPNLKKYYVAIPNDPSDARLKGQDSMLEKWNSRVAKWKEWAKLKNMDVEFFPWWASDMIERLQRIENAGLVYFWFNKDELTNQWVNEVNSLAIADLGKRYTPEVHVELDISSVFHGIARDKHFEKKFTSYVDDMLINARKVIDRYNELEGTEKLFGELKENVTNLNDLFNKTILQGVTQIDYELYAEHIDKIISASDDLHEFYTTIEREIPRNKDYDHGFYKKYGYEISRIDNLDKVLYSLREYLRSIQAKIANHPYLLIEGEAGIGKSHLLADAVTNLTSEGKGCLLLLGQQFVTEEEPWHQIFKKLHLRCSPDEFLGALSAKAQITGSRFIIFIDAINEGKGKYFWGDNIKAFINKVSRYEWIGLVLSIRSSYVDLIAPREEIKDEQIIRYTHRGFADKEYEASKIFFTNYGIELPSVPLLHPEFQNPLFLILFCEGLHKAGHTKIPDGIQGVTSIINFFIDSTNAILQKPKRLDYPKNVNIVKQAIESLMSEKLKKNLRYIKYEDAFLICDEILSKFSSKRNLIDELISEGVLSKNLFHIENGKYEEGIYLTYERFEDHIIISRLLSESTDLEISFSKEGELYQFIKDEASCYYNRGIIDALSIQLPEKLSRELHEFTKHLNDSGQFIIAESFVDSLLWRKIDSIHDGLKDYINDTVCKYDGTFNRLMDTMISVSVIPNHPFNALELHKLLLKDSMPDRDMWWSFSYLRDQFDGSTSVKRLIDWAWDLNKKEHISDESILLASIAISWFLCSPNRVLRDYATKSLVCLLQHRLHLVINLLKEFEEINDPYIYERLFAVAYGASLRASNTVCIPKLSEYIFETIFNKEEIYPHILLRDYARGVIEYTYYLEIPLSFDIALVRPPYKSTFPESALSNDELRKKYHFEYDSKDYKNYFRSQNAILRSMTTEYGKGVGGYGDFGRYTFESALRHWKIDAGKLSNIAVEWIFEKYGYSVEKHGELDSNISYQGRKPSSIERIGKKYQWIAMYEMLARVADNITEFREQGIWREDLERDNYSGPWEPYVRDIDPTLLIKDTGNFDEDTSTNFWWITTDPIESELSDDDWLSYKEDIPKVEEIISIKDEAGCEWLILEGYPEWSEKRLLGQEKYDKPHKRMWWHLRSYLVKNKDWNKFNQWSQKQNFRGSWMPESSSRYEIFNREYYWSPSFNFFQKSYYGGGQWQTASKWDGTGEFDVMLTADQYMWEKEFDFSKEKAINFLRPSKHVFENMQLFHSDKDGEFIDSHGRIICFDPSVSFNSKSFLLVRKNEFIKYLEENDLKVVWTMIGEKQIIGGLSTHRPDREHNHMEMSGCFMLQDKSVVGKIDIEVK